MKVCIECGVELGEDGFPHDSLLLASNYNIPFKCLTCGAIKVGFKAIRDVVFLYLNPLPYKIGSVVIPEVCRQSYLPEKGVVLSVGKGYWDKKKGFRPTTLKVGQLVAFDKDVPWHVEIEGYDGKKYLVKIAGHEDVKAVIEGDLNELRKLFEEVSLN